MVSSTFGSPQARLEAPFQRRIFLDVVAVFVRWSRRSPATSRASGRLEHVAGVNRLQKRPLPTSVCSSSIKRNLPGSRQFYVSTASTGLQIPTDTWPGQHGSQVQPRTHGLFFRNRRTSRADALRSPPTIAVLPTPGSPTGPGCSLSGEKHLHHEANFFIADDHTDTRCHARQLGRVFGISGPPSLVFAQDSGSVTAASSARSQGLQERVCSAPAVDKKLRDRCLGLVGGHRKAGARGEYSALKVCSLKGLVQQFRN